MYAILYSFVSLCVISTSLKYLYAVNLLIPHRPASPVRLNAPVLYAGY